jgi:hypothetical protein
MCMKTVNCLTMWIGLGHLSLEIRYDKVHLILVLGGNKFLCFLGDFSMLITALYLCVYRKMTF